MGPEITRVNQGVLGINSIYTSDPIYDYVVRWWDKSSGEKSDTFRSDYTGATLIESFNHSSNIVYITIMYTNIYTIKYFFSNKLKCLDPVDLDHVYFGSK